MPRRRTREGELDIYYPNCNDRNYKPAETAFVDEHVFFPIHKGEVAKKIAAYHAIVSDPRGPDVFKASPAHFYRMAIMNYRETKPDGSTRYSDDVWSIVLAVVRLYGMDAIRLGALDKHQTVLKPKEIGQFERSLHSWAKKRNKANRTELGYLDSLGVYVCAVIRQWQNEALSGNAEERRKATQWLKTTFAVLIPDLRGKRKDKLVGSKYDVMEFYYRELFRLKHVEHALRSRDGPRNHNVRLKQISNNFNLPIEALREFRDLDENNDPKRRSFPLTAKEMARRRTAHHFKITSQRVSNILSSRS